MELDLKHRTEQNILKFNFHGCYSRVTKGKQLRAMSLQRLSLGSRSVLNIKSGNPSAPESRAA